MDLGIQTTPRSVYIIIKKNNPDVPLKDIVATIHHRELYRIAMKFLSYLSQPRKIGNQLVSVHSMNSQMVFS